MVLSNWSDEERLREVSRAWVVQGGNMGDTSLHPRNQGCHFKVIISFMFWGVSSLKEGRSRSDRDRERNGRAQVSEPCDRDIEERDGHRDEASV